MCFCRRDGRQVQNPAEIHALTGNVTAAADFGLGWFHCASLRPYSVAADTTLARPCESCGEGVDAYNNDERLRSVCFGRQQERQAEVVAHVNAFKILREML